MPARGQSTTPSGRPYGARKQYTAQARQAGVSTEARSTTINGAPLTLPVPQRPVTPQGGPAVDPLMAGPVTQHQPITAGLDFGPGPGSTPNDPYSESDIVAKLERLALNNPSPLIGLIARRATAAWRKGT